MAKATGMQAEGETRDRILRAALQAFAEKGFDGASTRDIAARVGVNHGLIPYYFGTKEKLWQSAVDRAFADLEESLEQILRDPDIRTVRERAARMIRAYVRFVARRPEFVALMNEEGKRRGSRMRWIVDRHVKRLYDAMAALWEQVRDEGGPDPGIAPVHWFYVLAGASGTIFHQAEECRRVTGVDPFDPAVVDEHARVVERMLLGPEATAPTRRRRT